MWEKQPDKYEMVEGMVTVITPVYNAKKYIHQAMDSVYHQTYDNIEYYLVDDVSRDGSVKAIREYLNEKEPDNFKLIQRFKNEGAGKTRNAALWRAKGQYIAFLDADDYWEPEKLAGQIAFMQENGYAMTYTNFRQVTEDGEVKKERVDLPESISYEELLKNTTICCSTVVIDKKLAGMVRMPQVRKGQDTATWLKLLRTTVDRAYAYDHVLTSYRSAPNSISSNKLKALARTWHTYRELEQLPFFKALYYFSHYVWNAIKRRL